jgi:hypothetical protein
MLPDERGSFDIEEAFDRIEIIRANQRLFENLLLRG